MGLTRHYPYLAPLAGILGAVSAVVVAQSPPPCADEKSHQFDFWIGDWQVYAGETLAGHNTIQPILDGCVLQESWRGAQGSAGSSLNFFDPQRGKWRQFWVWRNGSTLELEGERVDDRMILQGDSVGSDGQAVRNRITFYDNADGTVRQHWETSSDQGQTWKTAFDGLYRKSP